jgi:hypothetical protein
MAVPGQDAINDKGGIHDPCCGQTSRPMVFAFRLR